MLVQISRWKGLCFAAYEEVRGYRARQPFKLLLGAGGRQVGTRGGYRPEFDWCQN